MKPHVIYGRAHWETPEAPAMSADVGIDRSSEVGFRLVSDAAVRIYRGGPWHYPDDYARAENRVRGSPGFRGGFLGFRLVREDA